MRDSQLGNSGQPTPEDYRHALRDVVTHCVYGVDMNPMALELARMALWLEGYTPDAPLGFIDHHFLLGNGLLGVMDPKMILDGVPDTAFTALTGDDAALCRDLKRRNRTERTGLLRMREAASFSQSLQSMDLSATALTLQQLDVLPDETLAEIAAKRKAYERLQLDAGTDGLSLALNFYCASYLLPKHGTETDTDVPTTQDVMNALLGQPVSERKKQAAFNLAKRVPLLHWRLGFAQVFARGGFSVILANPPWERMKLQEEEYFAERAPAIAEARNKAERERSIQALSRQPIGSPERKIYEDFITAKQIADAGNLFCHGARFPLTGVGDVNTYALFAETMRQITSPNGKAGFIVPSGLATDTSTKLFFNDLMAKKSLESFFEFENEGFFTGTGQGHSLRFALTTIVGATLLVDTPRFLFQGKHINELNVSERVFTISADEIFLVNPNTRTCPIFQSNKDAELIKKIYRRSTVLVLESADGSPESSPWSLDFSTALHMSGDSELFKTKNEFNNGNWLLSGNFYSDQNRKFLPLYEAKMIHIYNHRYSDFRDAHGDARPHILPTVEEQKLRDPIFFPHPYYWISSVDVPNEVDDCLIANNWRIVIRAVTDSRASARTLISSVIPNVPVGHSLIPLKFPANLSYQLAACFLANLSSLVLDYIARTKVGGLNLSHYMIKQFPVLVPSDYTEVDKHFIVERVLKLTFTSSDMSGWASDLGFVGPPFVFDGAQRAVIQAELDAYFAKLYCLNAAELSFILDPQADQPNYPSETFAVLKRNEVREYGEYRTRRLVLEAWDKLEQGQL
ncbi:MAG: hypothetical protein F2839_07140 [Actinobacteria bacterium]|uniref:site-specific DNA-methyltransferase (adenine-specific) n=1 Tax=freshwater metagenome TaxID=449393 RepID=A0A6J5ZTN1_9ZZZZ|nr:hypothetical protein [Actinomycetota bacterium]